MIVCQKCGKENQDHYKFCLGCGSELAVASRAAAPGPTTAEPAPLPPVEPNSGAAPVKGGTARGAAAPAPAEVDETLVDEDEEATSPTPPAGSPRVAPQEEGDDTASPVSPPDSAGEADHPSEEALADTSPNVGDPGAPPLPSADQIICSNCGGMNPRAFQFCGACGNRLHPTGPKTLYYGGQVEESKQPSWGRLALIRPDGTEGGSFALVEEETIIGRGSGTLFDTDGYLSPTHARLVYDSTTLVLEDAGSLNGVFIKITQEEPLASGDIFRIGQELLRFDAIGEPEMTEDGTEIMGSPNPGYWGRLSLISGPGIDGSAFPLMGDEMTLGRERGDILFPDDGYVSGIHAKIMITDDGYFLSDLGSSNGTFLCLTVPREIQHGTFILMGQQLFRVDIF